MNKMKITLRSLFVVCLLLFITAAEAYAAPEMSRIEGKDRYDTSLEISRAGWTAGSSKNAVLAIGDDFKDALCAAPLAKSLDAPILLTTGQSLSKKLEDEIDRLGVQKVYIIGHVNTISADLEEQVSSKGIATLRIAGEGLYGTSIEIAKRIRDFDEVIIASNGDFPDVLSIAPVAAAKGIPIFLSPSDKLPVSIVEYLKSKGIKRAYIIGGEEVISSAAAEQIPGLKVQRIFGKDRYETNTHIINEFSGMLNFDTVYIATGTNYPDALSGTSIASITSSPIFLTDRVPVDATKDLMSLKLASIKNLKVLGGEGVVSVSTISKLVNSGQGDTYNDYSLRYAADFKIKVFDNVYWVPVNALGKPKLTKEQIHFWGREPERLKSNISTLYDVIQYIRASDFKSSEDSILVEENGYNWLHHTPGYKAIINNEGYYATIANLGNYLLKGVYESEGFIHYFQKDGTEYVFNYVKHNGKYYAFDLTHYRNDFRYTAVETGNLKDYYESDYIAGNLHEAASLEDYIKYCNEKYNNQPELVVVYSSDNVLPTAVKKTDGATTIYFPKHAKDSIKVIHDVKNDSVSIDFVDGPSQHPSWL